MICGLPPDWLTDDDFRRANEDPCCLGAAMRGAGGCTCWEPAYDLQQRELEPGPAVARDEMCVDCAYRVDSPEMQGAEHVVGDRHLLMDLPHGESPFWCHQGIRRPRVFRHPDGRERAGSGVDYKPPIVDGQPFKASGLPADMCAGWAARRAKAASGVTDG